MNAGDHTRVYCCPECRSPVQRGPVECVCPACEKSYPILFGIVDFRLAPDRYLSLDDERAKAARLHAFAETHSFAETVAEYYRITDDVPDANARRFADYVLAGETRGRTVLSQLVSDSRAQPQRLLDAGCGAGGTVVAAARAGHQVCGVDIALRWLVIASKRLEEEGLKGELVCADIDRAPFPEASFDSISATDLFEHVANPRNTASAMLRLLAPGGRLYATGANRFTLATYPPAGLWGVGFLPVSLRTSYVSARRGFDTLRHLRMLSPRQLAGYCDESGYADIRLTAMAVPSDRAESLGGISRLLVNLYRTLRRVSGLRAVLLYLGPVFELSARRPNDGASEQRSEL